MRRYSSTQINSGRSRAFVIAVFLFGGEWLRKRTCDRAPPLRGGVRSSPLTMVWGWEGARNARLLSLGIKKPGAMAGLVHKIIGGFTGNSPTLHIGSYLDSVKAKLSLPYRPLLPFLKLPKYGPPPTRQGCDPLTLKMERTVAPAKSASALARAPYGQSASARKS